MNDLQLVRGNVEGGYNLAIGEPALLQKWLDFPKFDHVGPLSYPTLDGNQGLLDELRLLYPNPNRHIVIANGAKQALLAAFYAFQKVTGKTNVFHSAPYWPSYPTLAEMSGMTFNQNIHDNVTLEVATAPNNPDGGEYGGVFDIWDAAYAHWFYGWDGNHIKSRVQVYSASKLLGLSGARVGWLVTEDGNLADRARRYVEFTTSGVSTLSQSYVAYCLNRVRNDNMASWAFGEARKDMIHNGHNFMRVLGYFVEHVRGVPTDGKGMFAWFKVKNSCIDSFENALKKAKVTIVSGNACGGSDGHYRMNMCQEMDYTLKALNAIEEHMQ
jgi:aspartate/methionine/tyrosine aminotransferase